MAGPDLPRSPFHGMIDSAAGGKLRALSGGPDRGPGTAAKRGETCRPRIPFPSSRPKPPEGRRSRGSALVATHSHGRRPRQGLSCLPITQPPIVRQSLAPRRMVAHRTGGRAMSIATTLQRYLAAETIQYGALPSEPTL